MLECRPVVVPLCLGCWSWIGLHFVACVVFFVLFSVFALRSEPLLLLDVSISSSACVLVYEYNRISSSDTADGVNTPRSVNSKEMYLGGV